MNHWNESILRSATSDKRPNRDDKDRRSSLSHQIHLRNHIYTKADITNGCELCDVNYTVEGNLWIQRRRPNRDHEPAYGLEPEARQGVCRILNQHRMTNTSPLDYLIAPSERFERHTDRL